MQGSNVGDQHANITNQYGLTGDEAGGMSSSSIGSQHRNAVSSGEYADDVRPLGCTWPGGG